ncbi:MAG TPA: enolase C-terminal domain-like protein [Phycisphaerae bacterium]|nr:enolase C-terminal domain-like protein [Phycisphaerae bacterium]HPP27468.1 enolase C-terminal domain-like protein [Phycisphaerae bacterium]
MAEAPGSRTISAMRGRSQIHCLRLYPLAIPLRRPFEHAAKTRQTADPVVVQVELASGTLGYGETLARPYVTGETPESVIETIRRLMPDLLVELRPASFPEALEAIDRLPHRDADGTVINAARAAVELALLDAYSRHFERPISETVGWLDLPELGPPGSLKNVTYSAVVSGGPSGRVARKVRMMRWYGLRDFKLKVGYDDDAERVATVVRILGRSLGRETTLRLDANGAWTLQEAIARLGRLPLDAISCVEQPLARQYDNDLSELRKAIGVAVMPDESLLTMDDAERLVRMEAVDLFNIRISKNGGFLSALKLIHFARRHGLKYQLGCMVGETSILSAAGRRFLENAPHVCFAEGSYGRFLLNDDVVDRPVQFGCNGKPTPLAGLGWGIDVVPERLERLAVRPAVELRL